MDTEQNNCTCKYKEAFNNSPSAIIVFNSETKIIDDVNLSACNFYNLSKNKLVGMNIEDINILFKGEFFRNLGNARHMGNKRFKSNHECANKNIKLVEVYCDKIDIPNKNLYFSIIYDATEKMELAENCLLKEKEIEVLSTKDSLTGLYNRYSFLDLVDYEILRHSINKKNHGRFLVAILSINEFYEIKDALGHLLADKIFLELSSRIRSTLKQTDIMARYNEWQFALLIPTIKTLDELNRVINQSKLDLDTCITIENLQINVTTNLGVAIYPDDGKDTTTLIRNADIALTKARKSSANCIFRFDESLNLQIQEEFWMKNDLFNAMDFKELILNYQPIYDIYTNKLVGTEALIRWNHRKKGIIPPLKFIPIAESTGMIYPIGEWVLLNACVQNKKWQDLGYDPIYVSVNVSALQLERVNFYNVVTNILEKSKMDPKYLKIEITETYFTQHYGLISNNIKNLNNLGVRFSIDDFGTGYSSLGQLSELSINTIKIDRVFISNVDLNVSNSKIVKAVISLAKSLNIDLTAEGVEREEELKFLRENNCNIAQGYLFSKPIEANMIEKLF